MQELKTDAIKTEITKTEIDSEIENKKRVS
jgi:hypothetical protein